MVFGQSDQQYLDELFDEHLLPSSMAALRAMGRFAEDMTASDQQTDQPWGWHTFCLRGQFWQMWLEQRIEDSHSYRIEHRCEEKHDS
jgi:2-methylcitrate dehydratase PrpD